MSGRRAGFALDLGRCVGCGACVLACRLENDLPMGISWRRVLPLNLKRVHGGPVYHLSVACHHCEEPACLRACPADAYERLENGAVVLVTERCLGCRYCEMACSFGAPVYDPDAGVMTKCHFCAHRVEEGLEPACIAACPTGALAPLDPVREAGVGLEAEADPGAETGIQALPLHPALDVPGLSDPAGCRPSLRFALPRGEIREARFRELVESVRGGRVGRKR